MQKRKERLRRYMRLFCMRLEHHESRKQHKHREVLSRNEEIKRMTFSPSSYLLKVEILLNYLMKTKLSTEINDADVILVVGHIIRGFTLDGIKYMLKYNSVFVNLLHKKNSLRKMRFFGKSLQGIEYLLTNLFDKTGLLLEDFYAVLLENDFKFNILKQFNQDYLTYQILHDFQALYDYGE